MINKTLCSVFFILSVLQGMSSCTCSRTNSAEDDFNIPDSVRFSDAVTISEDVMERMASNIASPIEMASLVKKLGVPFSQKYIATTKNISGYNTSYAKAFNLGIFGADLGYINMYERTSLVTDYITVMKSLAEGIHIGQFFDFVTLKRLAVNNQNIDSLIQVSQQSFYRMDKYLQKNNRGNLSALMICGAWLEGLYLSTQILKDHPNDQLAESIGEQKVLFNELLLILRNFQSEEYVASIVTELLTIKSVYDGIRITIEVGDPLSVEENGRLKIIQTETSTIHYTEEQMNQIIAQTEKVRNKLIK